MFRHKTSREHQVSFPVNPALGPEAASTPRAIQWEESLTSYIPCTGTGWTPLMGWVKMQAWIPSQGMVHIIIWCPLYETPPMGVMRDSRLLTWAKCFHDDTRIFHFFYRL